MRLVINGPEAAFKECSGAGGVIRLETLFLRQERDRLSDCRISFLAEENAAERFLNATGDSFELECNGRLAYGGCVREISVRRHSLNVLRLVELRAVSAARKLSELPRYRIFQNERKTLSSLFDLIRGDFTLQYADGADRLTVPEPVLQRGETDFSFMLRLARRYGFHIFLPDRERKNLLLVGRANGNAARFLEDAQADDCRRSIVQSADGATAERVELEFSLVRDMEPLSVGTPVRLRDGAGQYCVTAFELRRDAQIPVMRYELERMDGAQSVGGAAGSGGAKQGIGGAAGSGGAKQGISGAKSGTGAALPDEGVCVTLEAEVVDNADKESLGRIQVRFTDPLYEDLEPDRRMWIPYRTPYAAQKGGFSFLPDKGDRVEARFCRDSLSAGESPRRDALDEPFRNPDGKYAANIHEKRISFTKDELELYADGTVISLKKDGITLLSGESEISVTDDGVTLKLQDNRITIQKGKLFLSTGGAATIRGKQVVLDGSDIVLK